MKLLLDTHALLWFIGDDPQLSANARDNLKLTDSNCSRFPACN